MARILAPRVELFLSLCRALTDANAILMGGPGSKRSIHLPRIQAQEAVDRIEPLACDILDEEFGEVPLVANAAVQTGSLALLERCSEIARGAPITLDAKSWLPLLQTADEMRVREMLAGPLRRSNLAAALSTVMTQTDDTRASRRSRRAVSLMDEAIEDPVSTNGGNSLHIMDALLTTRMPEKAATLLRGLVERRPDLWAEAARQGRQNGGAPFLIALHLAGAQMPEAMDMMSDQERAFLRLASSNHGRMEIRARFGSLETFLGARHEGSKDIDRRVDGLGDAQRASFTMEDPT